MKTKYTSYFEGNPCGFTSLLVFKTAIKRRLLISFSCVLLLMSISCGPSKSAYDKEYVKVWKELLKTEAWKNALAKDSEVKNLELIASTNNDLIIVEEVNVAHKESPVFIAKFNSLVSRAYFKIISEAKNADKRLIENLEYWNKKQAVEEGTNKDLKKNISIAKKKYAAHTQMLEGLKLWNIFSEDRSGDLDYFKAENENEIFAKFSNGEQDDAMISFLVYKLADLYHFED